MIDRPQFETILLDMDGTILDLAFDNYFWRELVPRCLARQRQLEQEQARADLFDLYAQVQGSLDWYCLDYWTRALGLDMRALKAASSQRIRFLPGAREFLVMLGETGKRVVLVTNAHEFALDLKKAVVGLDRYFDVFVSSHALGAAKEQAQFWTRLQAQLEFDPVSTVFIDDSQAVLDTAAAFGIGRVIAITRPDSGLPEVSPGAHSGVPNVRSLL
jgi:HAD superfamily hydrolase (TIGR01509 family)